MAKILLACNSEDLEVALGVKSSIWNQLGLQVSLDVEDDNDRDEGLDAIIELSTVLFVFEYGESHISAWVTIHGIDVAHSNYNESPFPEAIDFSDPDKGARVLENILYEDFGLDLRPQEDAYVQPLNMDCGETMAAY
ncbi:MAG: hypothetical protein SGBAC_002528 [Bacillariaceae sp.]